jgi:hypothetical protein
VLFSGLESHDCSPESIFIESLRWNRWADPDFWGIMVLISGQGSKDLTGVLISGNNVWRITVGLGGCAFADDSRMNWRNPCSIRQMWIEMPTPGAFPTASANMTIYVVLTDFRSLFVSFDGPSKHFVILVRQADHLRRDRVNLSNLSNDSTILSSHLCSQEF